MTPEQALQMLRFDPDRAFRECGFVVESTGGGMNPMGGRCTCTISPLPNAEMDNMFYIAVTLNHAGTDFYYPYVTHPVLVGKCTVPKNSPVGTLVFTRGMNGCSLQVNDVPPTDLRFSHCFNGCEVTDEHGEELCRIDSRDYMGRNHNQYQLYTDAMKKYTNPTIAEFSYYLITIKTAASAPDHKLGWTVFASPIQSFCPDKYKTPSLKKHYKMGGTCIHGMYKMVSF